MDLRPIAVFSDIHLAARKEPGLFEADEALAAALVDLLRAPCRVVFAGDFIEFLVPPPGRGHLEPVDPASAVQWLEVIIGLHPDVFDALGQLCRSPDHTVFILGGNHDPELAWPEVRWTLEDHLGGHIRWLVAGEPLRFEGGFRTLILHGDAFDEWNWVDHPRLGAAIRRHTWGAETTDHYAKPPGSALVTEVLEHLRGSHPWISSLKPEREAVVPLLAWVLEHDDLARFERLLKIIGRLARRAPIARLRARRHPQNLFTWADEAFGVRTANRRPVRTALVRKLLGGNREPDQLTDHLRQVSAQDGFFDLNVPDELAWGVNWLLNEHCDLVVMGHTHAAKAIRRVGRDGRDGLYLNTGTWMPLVRLPNAEDDHATWTAFLTRAAQGTLSDGGSPHFVTDRQTFALVEPEAQRAQLCLWGSPRPLQRFLRRDDHWQEVGDA